MTLGRVLGICAVPVGLFAGVIGVVLLLKQPPSTGGGVVFAVLGLLLVLAGIWMLITGRPHSLPFTAAKPGARKKSTDWSVFPDLR